MINVNDRLHGFLVNRVREIDDLHGTMYEMVHEKTGAELIWIAREDENKTFCIGFKTIPEDDSGVFHICEHSVLNGSEKYPVREPFVDLLKSSMQTFLNAMTYPDKTIYPVASRNAKDFLNLMDVYLDAVLHPLIHQNPNIFYQEGWHYEIRSEEEEPVYKGVVLNEMKGAFSSVDEVIVDEMERVLFPDNCYRFVSGGDPEKITDLSYEQFVEAHKKFYHPSNSRIVLDGGLDIDAALEKIDSFLAPYEKEDVVFSITPQKAVEATSREVRYEIGAEEDPKEKTQIAYSRILCDYDDVMKQVAWRVLSTVLAGSNEAPLKKAIIENKLGQDVEFDVIDEILQPYLMILIRNTDADKTEAIEATIRETIQNLVDKGLRKEELKAILNQMEFHYRDRKEPAGVYLAQASYRSWMYGGDPAMFLSIGDVYETLRQKAEEGYFEELLKEGLLAENVFSRVTAIPDKTLAEARQKKETEKLKQAKEAWGDEIKTYIERNLALDAWQATEDTPEQKATLPQLKLSDLEEEIQKKEPEEREINGVPVLLYPESSNGIVCFNTYFNLGGVTRDHLPEVALLTNLLMRLRTEDHTLTELQERIRGEIGSLSFFADAYTVNREKEICYPVIGVACSVLKQNVDKAVDIILEIMKKTVFEKDTILPLLQQSKENFRQIFISGGHAASVMRIGAHTSAESVAKECFNGYTSASYISALCEDYDNRYEEVIENCRMYCEELFTSSRMTLSVSGEEHLPEMKRLIESIPMGQAHRAKVHLPLMDGGDEGIQSPTQISFAAIGNNMQKYSYAYSGTVRVAAQILTYGYLWNEVRVKGGSYGTGFAASPSGNIACWSYRDPTPENTLKVYQGAADYLTAMAEEGADLTSYIIGTINASDPLQSASAKILSADNRWFSGIGYEIRRQLREEMLKTDCEDLKQFAKAMKQCIADGKVCVVGSGEALDRCGITDKHLIG